MSCVEQLKNNNQDAFNEIFKAYHAMIYNYILKRTSSSYCAEEVTQLVFIKLWNYRNKLSIEVSIEFQLIRIVKTTLIDYLRKMERNSKASFIIQRHQKAAPNDEINNAIALREMNTKLEKLMTYLPPIRKQVFEMSRFNDLSHREISEKLSITTKTVENHINLALKFLRSFFI